MERSGVSGTPVWPPMLWGIVALGAVLRIAWALYMPVNPVSDSMAYHTFATNIAEHGVYGWQPDNPGAYWPVGTSAIIAAIYMLFGPGFGPVVVFNILVGTAVIVQIFWLARHWFDTTAGLFAALIIAVWPSLVMYVSILASEVIFIFLVLGGLIAFERKWRSIWIGILLAGLIWTAAAYVRPVALLVPLVFGAARLLRGRESLLPLLLRVGVIYVMMMALIAPWSARNEAVFGERVMISTNFGPVFWMGNNPDTTGAYQSLPEWTRQVSETERASRLKAEAFDYVAAEPGAFVLRTVQKFAQMHARETIAVAWNAQGIVERVGTTGREIFKAVTSGYWFGVLIAAVFGLWLLWRSSGLWQMMIHPAFLGWMYFTWVHAIIIQGDRYHFPAIPFVAVLAALALAAWRARRQRGAET